MKSRLLFQISEPGRVEVSVRGIRPSRELLRAVADFRHCISNLTARERIFEKLAAKEESHAEKLISSAR